ncbi:actin-binding protein ipp [Plakobranchus ocellatus]|uniref:Actin-binding protein ipp n=1 Tax=Plakobranchus ocellatus TaxID=259542 RepID=A0AAV3ZE61_9GAST|nr:actin-binding protein ipp [Plakobranchus ocellatus]
MEASPPGYSRCLLKNLEHLWNESVFCDITLLIGRQKFQAHRNILAAASSFFKAMFLSGMEEQHQNEIELHELSADIFQAVMRFIYTGVVTVNAETCQDLLSAADMLGIEDVVDICSQFLIENLIPCNCIGIFAFADAHNLVHLKRQAQLFLEKNFVAAVAEDEFVHLEFKALLSILGSEKLHIENECQVLEAAMKWISADIPKRRKHLLQVLNEIRFNLVSQRQLQRIVTSCEDHGIQVMLTKFSKHSHNIMSFYPVSLYLPVDKPNMLTCPRENAKRYVYLVGGFARKKHNFLSHISTLDSVERYDVYTKKWHAYNGMSHPRSSHGIAVLDQRLVVAGGEDAFLITASVESFDPDENIWTSLPSMNYPRYGLGLASLDGFLYAIGGYIGSEIGATIERYDPNNGIWMDIDTMPNPRFCMAVVEYEGLIYVAGGLSELSVESDALESYNPVTKEWCPLARLKCPRAYHGLVAFDGCLYAVGGFNEYRGSLNSVEKYSLKDNCWSVVSPMQVSRAGAAVAVLGCKMYVFGGRSQDVVELAGCSGTNPSVTLDSCEFYDFSRDVWTGLPRMSCERCEAVAVVL